MNSTSYQDLKDHIFAKLRRAPSPLPVGKITEEIETVKLLITQLGLEMFAKIISADQLLPLTDADWERMQSEFETHFNVKMANGILIQGSEQQARDSKWWTSVKKQQNDNYYWTRYSGYLSESLPPEVVLTLDTDTDVVLNNIEDPSVEKFSRYGMVVGHVQSGKTANYAGVICKAADAGYKFIVVIAGGINNLRDQTQKRLNETFIGETGGVQVGVGKGNTDRNKTPYSLTTVNRDFNRQDADRLSQGLNFDNIRVPVLLVIKKNTKTLENVISWLEKQYKNLVTDHAMLVVDDESDYASVNTKEEGDPTAINKKLRVLLSLFSKSTYLAYTATPYANIFIDHEATSDELGKDLFPKDFIYALDAPSNYFGARKIFLDPNRKYLVPVNDNETVLPVKHKKDFAPTLPPTLYEAIRLFFINIAIRDLRGYGKSHNSMLLHATRFTDVHKKLTVEVSRYLAEAQKEFNSYGKLSDAIQQSMLIKDVKNTYEKQVTARDFEWMSIQHRIGEVVSLIVVRDVHQKSKIPLEYRDDVRTNAIVIGGASLARGFTVEGLSVSYFLRNTVFYDTLMQMGRWFGYRSGYEDLCRIFMPEDRIDDFAYIISATEDLMADFKLMSDNNRTPNDFGLAVRENPDSALQVTARNKQRNVREFYYEMQLDGKAKETSDLSSDPADVNNNIFVLKSFVGDLSTPTRSVNKTKLWENVQKSMVVSFLKKFKTTAVDPLGLTSRMPITFVRQYAEERATDWDVALYSGEGDEVDVTSHLKVSLEKRKIKVKPGDGNYQFKNRQVSSGNAEAIALNDTERQQIGSDRSKARAKMTKPLLMLHLVKPDFDVQPASPPNELAAFGVSFPGDVLSTASRVRLKINTVFYNNLLAEFDGDESDD